MTRKIFHAFTTKYDGRAGQLITPIAISLPFDPGKNETPQKFNNTQALWDTGATSSVITKKLAGQLGIKPIGRTKVRGVNGEDEKNVYIVNIGLPNKVMIPYVSVTECDDLVGNVDALIGMNIISSGDFAVTNVDGKTTMSFRLPSIHEIDYVVEAKKQNSVPTHGIKGSKSSIKKKRKKERSNKKLSRKKKK